MGTNSFKRIVVACVVGAGVCGYSATRLFAEDKPAAPSPEEQMKMYMELGKPSKEHEILKQMEGKFDAVTKEWQAPDAPPMESKGTSENHLMFGGRYLHCMFKGSMMGMPMEGVQVVGYDRIKNEYFGYWMDSMSTAGSVSKGKLTGNTLEMTSEMTDPITKQPCSMRMTTVIESPDKHVFTMYMPDPVTKKEVKGFEITYTKAK